MRIASVILAAGAGTRMKSDLPKVLHPLLGKPMVTWCVEAADAAGARKPVLVVGHGQDQVRTALGDRVEYVEQAQRLGTGHAVMQARDALVGRSDAVLVTYGDMPLLRNETVAKFVRVFEQESAAAQPPAVSIVTIVRDDSQGFGRIVRDASENVRLIVEEVDCSPEQLAIRELNAGVYCFDAAWLWENLSRIPLSPKGEYYLPDMIGLATQQGRRVVTMQAPAEEVNGINTRVHLADAVRVLRRRILERHMLNGVTVVDPDSAYIDDSVRIGQDTVILPGVILQGDTIIGCQALIGPHTHVVDSQIGDGCRVVYSVVEQAIMEEASEIGPFGHLRKGAHLGTGVHMGNFGEVKNSYLGPGAKMGHFSYLGDATVGAGANIGAGTITCNYDGERKHPTKIGAGAFVGSDTLLVAPVEVGDGARTGAGSVVTHDVPANETVYGVPARKAASRRTEQESDGPVHDEENRAQL